MPAPPPTTQPPLVQPSVPIQVEPPAPADISLNGAGPSSSDSQTEVVEVQPVYRPSDRRPQHDDARAEQLRIRKYSSRRLILYTDIEHEAAAGLPRLMDQAFEVWSSYFGDLLPSREGMEFQMTGYIMQDRDRFIAAGMLPENLPDFPHGRHRGAEFWMNEQRYEYYRRHLLIHEGTHCFMTILPDRRLPLWYLEGMAELFATHTLDETGRATLGVMPNHSENFIGFGRVQMIQEAVRQGRPASIQDVIAQGPTDFSRSFKEPYAWSWALCRFLESHPKYSDRFHQAAHNLDSTRFAEDLAQAYASDSAHMQSEWDMFIRSIDYGYDIERHAIDFPVASPLSPGQPRTFLLAAERGWQSTQVQLSAGQSCQLACAGRVTLAEHPRPWLSESQGITIEYAAGRPIGRVLGTIWDAQRRQFSDPIDIGSAATIQSPVTGTLYLRVNDHVDRLRDNSGAYQIEISQRAR